MILALALLAWTQKQSETSGMAHWLQAEKSPMEVLFLLFEEWERDPCPVGQREWGEICFVLFFFCFLLPKLPDNLTV